MDLKGIHYSKSNSDKVNVNISMYTLALFMYYSDIINLYASLQSFDFQSMFCRYHGPDIVGLSYEITQ